jgi:tetrahydromethanopterin S-methyltransferase subunit B
LKKLEERISKLESEVAELKRLMAGVLPPDTTILNGRKRVYENDE